MTKEEYRNIITLKDTHTAKEIAGITGYSYEKVRYWLRKARIEGIPYKRQTRKGLTIKNLD